MEDPTFPLDTPISNPRPKSIGSLWVRTPLGFFDTSGRPWDKKHKATGLEKSDPSKNNKNLFCLVSGKERDPKKAEKKTGERLPGKAKSGSPGRGGLERLKQLLRNGGQGHVPVAHLDRWAARFQISRLG